MVTYVEEVGVGASLRETSKLLVKFIINVEIVLKKHSTMVVLNNLSWENKKLARELSMHRVTCSNPSRNKGHFGSVAFGLYWEVVLWWEVRITIVSTRVHVMSIGAIASVLYTEVVLWWEGPLQEAPLYM